jgi:2-polyprenyl-6-methoxyphenol hydroxylase-like FAD-dependent oxidoreductase
MARSTDCEVLVVGAGPVGLLTTLFLAQAGIDVVLIEALPDVDESPRAMTYGPAAVIELERAGVAAEARETGMEKSDYDFRMRWINIDHELIGQFQPEDRIPGAFDTVICGQYQLAQILKSHVNKWSNAKVSRLYRPTSLLLMVESRSFSTIRYPKFGSRRDPTPLG